MGCRIGMATNVGERASELKRNGIVPTSATYRTLVSGLTYKKRKPKKTNSAPLVARTVKAIPAANMFLGMYGTFTG